MNWTDATAVRDAIEAASTFAEIAAAGQLVCARVCLTCGFDDTMLYRERVTVPEFYPPDARAMVESHLRDGAIAFCALCRTQAHKAKKRGDIALQVMAKAMRASGQTDGDMPCWSLVGALIEHAWQSTRNPDYGPPFAPLAAAIEVMTAYPIAPLVSDDRKGLVNGASRLIENVGVSLAVEADKVYVAEFYSYDRGKGNGTRAMEQLCAIADRHSAFIGGIAEPHQNRGGVGPFIEDANRLFAFYEKFGFREAGWREGCRVILRKPRTPEPI